MYSDKDFQTFWFRYKTEGEPHEISINSFCINQGVPYKQFYAWFKKYAKDTVIPVEIEGAPTDEETDEVRQSRLQQQTYNDENNTVSTTPSQKLDVVLQQLQETRQELTDTKRKLETTETLLADANKKNLQFDKERKDLENEIALLRSDLYSGSKSQQSGRSFQGFAQGREIWQNGLRKLASDDNLLGLMKFLVKEI